MEIPQLLEQILTVLKRLDEKTQPTREVMSIKQAADYGLTPVGELHYDVIETPIEYAGKKYSFGWLVLRKTS